MEPLAAVTSGDYDFPFHVTPFFQRLFICASDERSKHQSRQITHMIVIANPGAVASMPTWFNGQHLQLWFGDVVSEIDAKRCRTKAATMEEVRQAIEFFRAAWKSVDSRVLISCDYGASRSPGLAYVCVADQVGPGHESEALKLVMQIRPVAVPNKLVIEFGDAILNRRGELLKPLREFYRFLNAEFSGDVPPKVG